MSDPKLDLKSHPLIKKVREKIRVQKVVATRSVKGRGGDHYVGFSAAWDSLQDDAGGGASLISTLPDADESVAIAQAGMTMKEAKVASLLLGMQADVSADQNAWAGGNATDDQLELALRTIRANYGKLLTDILIREESASTSGS